MTIDSAFANSILDNLFEGVYFIDRSMAISYWSHAAARLTGYAADELVGTARCRDITVNNDDDMTLCESDSCPARLSMVDGQIRQMPVAFRHKDGRTLHTLTRFVPVHGRGGEISGVVKVFQDISGIMEERKKTSLLERLAVTDTVTDLVNRAGAVVRLNARLNEFNRYGWPFAVLFCDLDNFKTINDTFGHHVGDQVLKALARIFSENFRSSDFVSRWGGDEFLVVLQNIDDEKLNGVAHKVLALVNQCTVQAGTNGDSKTVRVTCSIGASSVKADDCLDSLLKKVDALMYQSKKAGGNRVTICRDA